MFLILVLIAVVGISVAMAIVLDSAVDYVPDTPLSEEEQAEFEEGDEE